MFGQKLAPVGLRPQAQGVSKVKGRDPGTWYLQESVALAH